MDDTPTDIATTQMAHLQIANMIIAGNIEKIYKHIVDANKTLHILPEESTPLWFFASMSGTYVLEYMFGIGADTTLRTHTGDTCLHFIIKQCGSKPISIRQQEITMDNIKLMIEHGIVLDAQNTHGETALMLALSIGFNNLPDLPQLLLASGASTKPVDNNGDNAVIHAVKMMAHHIDIERTIKNIHLLFKHGADMNQLRKCGTGYESAMSIALKYENQDLMNVLQSHGAKISMAEVD